MPRAAPRVVPDGAVDRHGSGCSPPRTADTRTSNSSSVSALSPETYSDLLGSSSVDQVALGRDGVPQAGADAGRKLARFATWDGHEHTDRRDLGVERVVAHRTVLGQEARDWARSGHAVFVLFLGVEDCLAPHLSDDWVCLGHACCLRASWIAARTIASVGSLPTSYIHSTTPTASWGQSAISLTDGPPGTSGLFIAHVLHIAFFLLWHVHVWSVMLQGTHW